jgi:outer membrane murein-binding lipoprotein Lpp
MARFGGAVFQTALILYHNHRTLSIAFLKKTKKFFVLKKSQANMLFAHIFASHRIRFSTATRNNNKRRKQMKDRRTRTVLLLTAVILASTSLISCKNTAKDTNQITAEGQAETTAKADQVQTGYYESVIKDLEEQLLNAKEESYIISTEYKLQLEILKENIASLEDKLDTPQETLPPSDTNNNIYNEGKTPQADHLSVTPKFKYTEKNGVLTITGYNGSDASLTLPSHIDGTAVKFVGDDAFKQSKLEKVVISDGIESIGWFAFSGCNSLCEITIPPSVTSIGHGAFDGCRMDLIIKCTKGSYAEAYAKSWGFITVSQ